MNNALGTNAVGTTVATGATLDFQNVTYSTTEAITLAGGTLRTSTGTSTVAGNISLTADSAITQANGTTLNIDGTINGGQALSVNSGTGTIKFGGIVGGGTPLTDFDVTAGLIQLAANITANAGGGNTLTFTGPVELDAG